MISSSAGSPPGHSRRRIFLLFILKLVTPFLLSCELGVGGTSRDIVTLTKEDRQMIEDSQM